MTRAGSGPGRTAPAIAAGVGLAVALGAGAALVLGSPTDGGPSATPPPSVDAPDAVLPEAEGAPGASTGPQQRPDPDWVSGTSTRRRIPERALLAYATATLVVTDEQPECGLGWNTLAAIGQIESSHGTFDGSSLDERGAATPPIVGIPLAGDGVARIPDSDRGVLDGDRTYDRAVGPMQFIPSTWELWGADGDGDGVADPQDVDDAALAAARYLCADDRLLMDATGWTAAVLSYNNSLEYAAQVARIANGFAA